MNDNLIKAQDVLLDKINQIFGKFGLNSLMAQIYAILYLSNKPLSLDDMGGRLKISKGSASINIRALERYGAVRQVWIKGSRKDYYEAEPDISKVITERLHSIAYGRLADFDDMLKSAYKVLSSINSCDESEMKEIQAFRNRVGKLEAFYRQAKSLFDLFNATFHNRKSSNLIEKDKDMVSMTDDVVAV